MSIFVKTVMVLSSPWNSSNPATGHLYIPVKFHENVPLMVIPVENVALVLIVFSYVALVLSGLVNVALVVIPVKNVPLTFCSIGLISINSSSPVSKMISPVPSSRAMCGPVVTSKVALTMLYRSNWAS